MSISVKLFRLPGTDGLSRQGKIANPFSKYSTFAVKCLEMHTKFLTTNLRSTQNDSSLDVSNFWWVTQRGKLSSETWKNKMRKKVNREQWLLLHLGASWPKLKILVFAPRMR